MKIEENRQVRRAELAEAIKRHRDLLHVLKIAGDRLPLSARERHARMMPTITEELHEMEVEYHDLNVQQIREESKNG